MIHGKTLTELATELKRQAETKKDYIANTGELTLTTAQEDGTDRLQVNGYGSFAVTDLAHDQIAERVGIPRAYYQRMRTEAPALLQRNVGHWFTAKAERRMIRTLDGKARAFLSDRYRPLDNMDLAEAVLPTVQQIGCRVVSSEITERRFYIQVTTDKIQGEVRKGDVVQAGLIISNSEVGCGSLKVEPMIYRLVCTNGMIRSDHSIRKYHVGRGGADGEGMASEFYRDETRLADDRAFFLKVRDVVSGSVSEDGFQKILRSFQAAAGMRIEADPVKVVEATAERLALTEGERGSVLNHLIAGGDLSAWGLANAVTRTAEDARDYDRAVELERLGGDVIALPKQEWDRIAVASN